MKKTLLFAATIFCFINIINAQAGQLDSSFGRHGIVVTDMGKNKNNISLGRKVLVLPDGSMYIIYVTQLNYEFPEDFTYGVAFITKKHSDGTTDSSYGNNGTTDAINISATDAAVQADGKIIIVGDSYFHDINVARYNTNGTLDSTFSQDGKLTVSNATSVALQLDGKIVFGGGNNIFRYNTDGTADGTFGQNGSQTFDFTTNDVAIQKDRKIVAAGYSYWYQPRFIVARITISGNLDKTFSDDGIYKGTDSATDSKATSVAIQSDGKIVIATGSTDVFNEYLLDISVWRFTAGGEPDPSFSGDGKQTTEFGDYHVSFNNLVTIQNDGKIVAAGYSTVLRYNTDGSPDKSFSDDGMLTLRFRNDKDRASSLAIQGNDKIIVAGTSYTSDMYGDINNTFYAVARLNTNGASDNTFAKKGVLVGQLRLGDTEFKSVAVQKDGKIVAAGVTFNGHDEDFAVVRYNVNGTFDNTFSGDGKQITDFNGSSNAANAVTIQSDGKIVVAGYNCVDSLCYSKHFAIVRYNTDGTPDNTFSNDGKQTTTFNITDEARSIALQMDEKIVVAGYTSNQDSSKENFAVARYNTDGSLDNTFSGDGKKITDYGLRHDEANAIAVQNDGKIVIGGSSGYGPQIHFALVRYNSDGSIDRTFSKDGIRTTSFNDKRNLISSIAIQDDGKIVAAGQTDYAYANSVLGLARYNTDGSLDSSFSSDGLQTTLVGSGADYYPSSAAPVAIQTDGKIIAAANYRYNSLDEGFAIVRYNANGSLDSTFSEDGIQKNNGNTVYGIAVSNNEVYAVGHEGFGLYDAHFGFTGKYNLIDKSKNNAPVVSIIAPADNQIIAGPAASISIKAAAFDYDGAISKVEFYNGTTLLHTETVAPYTYTWTDVPFGKYALTAKATDNLGAAATSAVINISVETNKAPTVSITNPVNDQVIGGPLTIRFKAVAADIDGTVTKVEFYNGITLLHTETQAPYTYSWANVSFGTYAITAKATDNSGAVTVSEVVNITVARNSAPTVGITNPANGESFTTPANITVSAAAGDSDGTVSSVEFYADSVLIATQTISPYTFTWKNVAAGTYKITAKAIDNLGSSTVSAPVTVTVSNTSIVSNKPYLKTEKTALNDALSLRLSPNPSSNIVNIFASGLQANKPGTLSIISFSGIVLKTMQISSALTQLDVSSLASGVYTIKVVSGEKVSYKQFVKL